jgi:hypothetical protein
VQAPPPRLVSWTAEEVSTSLVREGGFRELLAAPAIVQGVGLHTFLAVFLI